MPPLPKKTKSGKQKGETEGKKGRKFLYFLLILLAGFIYYKQFGIPKFLLKEIPEDVAVYLGLIEEEPITAPPPPREPPIPKLIARGFKVEDPAVPVNAAVEDFIKTLRPDVYFKDKNKLTFKAKSNTSSWSDELRMALDNRVCLKKSFYAMLNTFYEATPDGMGYLDLVYQAPNYYFARVVTIDASTRSSFINNLRAKGANLNIMDTVSYRNGNFEFSIQGSIRLPSEQRLGTVPLSKMNPDILALRSLATLNGVRLEGLENPIEEDFGLYRIVVLKTVTEADYPSLLNFADTLQKSDIAFGIQKFSSSPSGSDKMQSVLEFVMYIQ